MNILLTALNAKYYHSCLALRCLKAACPESVIIREFTINHRHEDILAAIYRLKPDVVGFSCYIWNVEATLRLVESLKKVLPGVKVVLGGPEVSFCAEEVLLESDADAVVIGEGELAFAALIEQYAESGGFSAGIPGVALRAEGGVTVAPPAKSPDMNAMPFPYEDTEEPFSRILYYESSRGCPCRCSYCMSGLAGKTRFRDARLCHDDLRFFLERRVKQVKFVDRTFNCNKSHAMDIWRFLMDNDNGITNFHFEIRGDLLDEQALSLLRGARAGLFQFEVGVQSTNERTLRAIGRDTDTALLFQNIKKLKEQGNIHLHIDLIACLPHEDYASFAESFDAVYAARPDQFQLGFLKLLKGSALRANAAEYGIVYESRPPYEALYTGCLPYDGVLRLKSIEEIIEIYYNSNRCAAMMTYAVKLFCSPFRFCEAFADYRRERGFDDTPVKEARLYDIAFGFLSVSAAGHLPALSELLLFDMMSFIKTPAAPHWAPETENEGKRGARRLAIIRKFHYDIIEWLKDTGSPLREKDVYVMFDYSAGKTGARYSAAEVALT